MRLIALTRAVSASLADCELTHLQRGTFDLEKAERQHLNYERVLQDLGCEVRRLPGSPELPDCVFVEDTALVTEDFALITRPGAESRRPEPADTAAAIKGFRTLHEIESPGTLDGGDVLRIGRLLYVGVGARTNAAGVGQLAALAEPFGFEVHPVTVEKCLHLKTAVTQVAGGVLLYNPDWVSANSLPEMELLPVDATEPFAANSLLIGKTLVYGAGHPRTEARLRARGIDLRIVDISELAKAEAGVTCCSIVFSTP